MVIHLVRGVYLLVVLAFTISFAFQRNVIRQGPTYVTLYILIPVVAAFSLVMVDMFWRRKRLQVLSGLFFGLVAGLVIAYVLAQIVDLVGSVFTPVVDPMTATGSHEIGVADDLSGGEPPPGPTAPARPRVPAAPETRPTTPKAPQATTEPATQPARLPGKAEKTRLAGSPVDPVLGLVKVLLGASAVFMCVSFVLQTKDDFRFVIPYVEFSKQTKGARPILLDTSVIIDGRIADIADTRILESEIIVPRFILAELQAIADSDDKLKRNRGRRGLDVLNRLQTSDKIDVRIMEARMPDIDDAEDVDAKLVTFAQHLHGRVVTIDYNLNKVAQLRGVDVININDMANALKPVVLPGEEVKVKVIRAGEEPGQGVGYLDDGTMIVAEQARDHVGKEIIITVTSVLQTSAGRMIFGRLQGSGPSSGRPRRT